MTTIINVIRFGFFFVIFGSEMKIGKRSLRRIWFATMFAIGLLFASMSGVDAAPVQGAGIAPANAVNAAQARIMALRAAKVEAMRNGQQQGFRQIVGVLSENYDAATKTAVVVLDMQ